MERRFKYDNKIKYKYQAYIFPGLTTIWSLTSIIKVSVMLILYLDGV